MLFVLIVAELNDAVALDQADEAVFPVDNRHEVLAHGRGNELLHAGVHRYTFEGVYRVWLTHF